MQAGRGGHGHWRKSANHRKNRGKHTAQTTSRLSDAYKDAGHLLGELKTEIPLELTVTVFNINEGFNKGLISRSPLLHGYVVFNAKIRENIDSGMSLEEAMGKAINDCKSAGILKNYLERHGKEVSKMLREEWDQRIADEYLKRDYFERGQQSERNRLSADIAAKDAIIAQLMAQLDKNKQQST